MNFMLLFEYKKSYNDKKYETPTDGFDITTT